MSKKTIGIASLIYGVTILLSRLIGLIREAVIGRVLGVGSEADVYWTAFIIPDFLNYLLAGGILSIAFIPIFQRQNRAKPRTDREDAMDSTSVRRRGGPNYAAQSLS